MYRLEKLLYSRRDAAEALSLSIRSIDYLITAGQLTTRRVGGKILIPAGAVRRFAREDHPQLVRSNSMAVSTDRKPPVFARPRKSPGGNDGHSEYEENNGTE
jgi:hypothetical protein